MTKVISVRVSEEERNILDEAAKLYGGGVSSMVKEIVFERLEDDYDLKVVKEYEAKKESGTARLYTPEETWKAIGV